MVNKLLFAFCIAFLCGCHSTRKPEIAVVEPHVRVLTYNVNWGAPRPELVAEIIQQSRADIICLQETTPDWETVLRKNFGQKYPCIEFRESKGRMGGGLAFLSKLPSKEIAYIPSATGWFDGWIMAFETPLGPVQVLNVHLRPPVSDNGSWLSGYLGTRDDRVVEMQQFYARRELGMPMLITGDFNDGENSRALRWLKKEGMINALPEFDSRTPTWQWRVGLVTLKRRMDHIVYSPQLRSSSARVIKAGASDHFPVEADFVAVK